MNDGLGLLEAQLTISRLSRERALRRQRLDAVAARSLRVRERVAGLLYTLASRLDPQAPHAKRRLQPIRINKEQHHGQA
jgi:hypothetical protein